MLTYRDPPHPPSGSYCTEDDVAPKLRCCAVLPVGTNSYKSPPKTEYVSQMFMMSFSISRHRFATKILLCLVEIVGSSVVNIVAESSSNHGEGVNISVILL